MNIPFSHQTSDVEKRLLGKWTLNNTRNVYDPSYHVEYLYYKKINLEQDFQYHFYPDNRVIVSTSWVACGGDFPNSIQPIEYDGVWKIINNSTLYIEYNTEDSGTENIRKWSFQIIELNEDELIIKALN